MILYIMQCFHHFPLLSRVSVLDNGSLRISNITKLDAGLYTCVARNQFGVASSAGTLVVKGKLGYCYLDETIYYFWCRCDKRKLR